MWVAYQELIDNERRDFKARDADVYTLRDVVEAKYREDQRTKKECLLHFQEIENLPLSQCTFERLQEYCTYLLNKPVQRGGCSKNGSGRTKLPEKTTVLRKFAYVQSAVNHFISLGCDLENNFEKIVARLRSEIKGEKTPGTDPEAAH